MRCFCYLAAPLTTATRPVLVATSSILYKILITGARILWQHAVSWHPALQNRASRFHVLIAVFYQPNHARKSQFKPPARRALADPLSAAAHTPAPACMPACVHCVQQKHGHLTLQVLDALPDLGPYELRLGHSALFAAAVAGLGLPPEVSPASVMALLASAIKVSASQPATDTPNNSNYTGTAAAGGSAAAGGGSSSSNSHAAAGHAGGAAGAGGGAGAAASSGSTRSSSSSSGGRANVWPAVRVGLDGLGLDSKPVSRCRQCVLKLPGGSGGCDAAHVLCLCVCVRDCVSRCLKRNCI